jgi:hypothetical protein
MRFLSTILVLFASVPVWAQPELPMPASLSERVMLVWGGGRTREEAEAFMSSYQERAVDWARVLELGPGYPRVVDGAEFPGLRPGYYFVVLGVCDVKEGAELTKVFKALEPLSYSRRVLWEERDPLVCPSLLPGWTFGKSVQARVSGGTLAAATFDYAEEVGTREHRNWLLVLALLKKGDAESTVVEPPEDGASSEVKSLKVGRGEVLLEEWLTHPTCDAEPRSELHTRTWRFSAQKGEIVTKQVKKPLQRKDCTQEPGAVPVEE